MYRCAVLCSCPRLKNLQTVNDKDFVYTTSWIDTFKLRHNICCGKVSGEARGVSYERTAE
jgi:hypothetical protein